MRIIAALLFLLNATSAMALTYRCEGTFECYKLPAACEALEAPEYFGNIEFTDQTLFLETEIEGQPVQMPIPVIAVSDVDAGKSYFINFENTGVLVTLFETGALTVIFSNEIGGNWPGALIMNCEAI